MVLFKVCRQCGEEFRPEIERCADCGGQLEPRYELEPESLQSSPLPGVLPAGPPEPGGGAGALRSLYVATTAAEIEPLARRLGGAEIPFNVAGSATSFQLLVAENDLVRAHEVLEPWLAAGAGEAHEAGACPACGTASAGAAECPECGLVLGAEPTDDPPSPE